VDSLRRPLIAAVALVAAAVAALAAGAPATTVGAGPRIVSLAPHITELLFAAGAGPFVVGATEFSDHPAAARKLPRIGDAFRLDYERIVALRPDFAVAWQSGTPAGALAQLQAVGVRVEVLRVQSLDDIAAAIEELGRLADTADTALSAAAAFRSGLADIRAQYAGRSPVRVFVELDHEPLFTVTGRHLISEMLSICGGTNVFAGLPGLAPSVDLEAVLAAAPEAILYTGPDRHPALHWRGWPEVPAVRNGDILQVPADLVSRATPRAVAGARAVCEALDGVRQRRAARAH
jgi:iron complex transport system substrate-binding protein